MSDGTKIEWTEATWNPITGCSIATTGCAHCYAMKLAGTRLRNHPSRVGLTIDSKNGPVWTGEVRFNEGWLTQPLQWKRPRMIFVCAHGDLFHESVPDEWIDKVFAVMGSAMQHTYQVLTKRAERMRDYVSRCRSASPLQPSIGGGLLGYHPFNREILPPRNIWLGVSTERQQEAAARIPHLLATPAAVRWLSAEPLLGPIDLHEVIPDPLAWNFANGFDGLDWVVAGGESGDGARPMHPDWARSLRDQCAVAGVPFFFKQWGTYLPVGQYLPGLGKVTGCTAIRPGGRVKLHCKGAAGTQHAFAANGIDFASTDDGRLTFHVGKKAAGRLLDGVTHDAMPEHAA